MVQVSPAGLHELEAVWSLVKEAVAHMNTLGNPQWGPDYPTRDHFLQALEARELYAARDEAGAVMGTMVLNTCEEAAYAPLPWSFPSPALVVHKLAVPPRCQRRGVGRALLRFAQDFGREEGLASIHMDTYCLNHRMQRLLEGEGFHFVAPLHLPGRPLEFLAYERGLSPAPTPQERN